MSTNERKTLSKIEKDKQKVEDRRRRGGGEISVRGEKNGCLRYKRI